MRNLSLVSFCVLLLATAACGSSPSDSGGGEIQSQEDVQRFFQALMPELVAAFTELADQQPLAPSSLSSKGGGGSSVPCPEGGSINVDTVTGQATMTNCGARGVIINAALSLFVQPTGPSSYLANFNGVLMVTGTFTGTVEVLVAVIEWTDPATDENTYWEITVDVGGQIYLVTSADSGGGGLECPAFDGGGTIEGNGPCDDDGDCLSGSCRDPEQNPSEGCTCRHPDGGGGGDCAQCLGTNAAGPNQPPDPAISCTDGGTFMCNCDTESGGTVVFALSPTGCF
jgi:hypothetical protein